MIGIQLESGAFLYLPPNTSIRHEMFSSIFYEQQGDYSYPFNIPIKENAYHLGYPESMMNKSVQKKYNVKIWRHGNFWKNGLLRIRNIKGNNYVSNLNINGGYFADQIKDVNLPDLTLGGSRNIVPQGYIAFQLSGSGTTGNVALLVFNPTFVEGFISKFVAFNTSISQTLIDLADAFNADTSGMSTALLDRVEASGDTIKVYSSDENIPRYEAPASTPGTGRLWTQIDAFNNGDMVTHMGLSASSGYPTYDYTFFTVKNPSLYEGSDNDDLKTDFCGYVNYYASGKFHGNGESSLSASNYAFTATPFPYMLYIFQQCFSNFGYSAEGSFLEDSEIKKLSIYNNYGLDKEIKNVFTGEAYGNSWSHIIDLKNHVPDISIGSFLNAIKQSFFLAFFYNLENKHVTVKTLNEILDNPEYDDWTSKADPLIDEEKNEADGYIISPSQDSDDDAIDEFVKDISSFTLKDAVDSIDDLPDTGNEAGDIRLVNELNSYYKVDSVFDSGTGEYTWAWSFYSENIGSYTVGNGKEKISLGLGTTVMERITSASGFYDKNWWVPFVKQEGSGTGFSMGKNDFSLRLLFYRGLQPGTNIDTSAMNYPMGASHEKDYNFDSLGDYSLALDGESGLYEKWGKKWLTFKENTRIVEMPLRLSPTDIQNLDFSRKKRINKVDYLLAKLDFTDTMQGMKIAVGLFYKV